MDIKNGLHFSKFFISQISLSFAQNLKIGAIKNADYEESKKEINRKQTAKLGYNSYNCLMTNQARIGKVDLVRKNQYQNQYW